jgi:hypothetical protein
MILTSVRLNFHACTHTDFEFSLFTFSFIFFQMRLSVKWELKNENGNDIVCALIPVKIM